MVDPFFIVLCQTSLQRETEKRLKMTNHIAYIDKATLEPLSPTSFCQSRAG
jgi:hypothetical protein